MTNDFLIVMDKERIDLDLLRLADDSLPRVMRQLETCTPFAGITGGSVVVACLVEAKDQVHDIVSWAVREGEQGKGFGRAMLEYVLDYLRSSGARWVETGCGNASVRTQTILQKAGFRFLGVWPDYYLSDTKTAHVENSIVERDMVRFRIDLQEQRLSTVGFDGSGRTR
jgi:RimJ/RimL family protein N-acetyltransferase